MPAGPRESGDASRRARLRNDVQTPSRFGIHSGILNGNSIGSRQLDVYLLDLRRPHCHGLNREPAREEAIDTVSLLEAIEIPA